MRASLLAAATLGWILLTGGACPAAGQTPQTISSGGEPAAAEKAGKELHALRLSGPLSSMRIDGRVDEEAWMQAQAISDFVEVEPYNMMPPTEMTSVRVAYDDRYLYIAVQMLTHDPSELRGGLGR